VDGFWYQSRLTGGDCFAIFERTVMRLNPQQGRSLELHPELPRVLEQFEIRLEV
jgi:hypothetical protein